MCGFVVVMDLHGRPVDRAALTRATNAIRHRGPDDESFYAKDGVAFGFRRLAIVDLSSDANQPMDSADGQCTIVYNGEIYNYVELRDELRALGYRFRTAGDTEVVLAAYDAWGPACLSRFNGMWVFVVHDRRRNILFGSRDRFGVKPLYLFRDQERLVLASEIKAIRATGWYQPNWSLIPAAKYLCRGHGNAGTECLYDGITAIEPGSSFTIRPDGTVDSSRFWTLPTDPIEPPADLVEQFSDLLEDAVRLRLRSDVPVGVSLSGGLDSTAIICAMARQRPKDAPPLMAFTYNSCKYDESALVADTIAQTGATLVPLQMSENELFASLPEVIAAHDEPVHSMAVVISYHLMRLARAHGIPVVLNGNGSDEVLAGYDSFFRLHWESVLRRDGPRAAYRHIKAFSKVHGGAPRPRFLNLLRSTVTTEMRRVPPYRWAAARFGSGHETDPWFSRELYTVLPDEHPGISSDPLNTWLTGSVNEFPLPLYLREEDRSCMAHSVEGRLPFMDYRLVSLISPLPGAVKMSGPWNKIILREAIRGRVPESVRSRAVKWGFAIPAADWVKGELHEPLRDMLESRSTKERGLYNTELILKDLERHCRGEIDVATRMIRVAQFEMWCRQVGIN